LVHVSGQASTEAVGHVLVKALRALVHPHLSVKRCLLVDGGKHVALCFDPGHAARAATAGRRVNAGPSAALLDDAARRGSLGPELQDFGAQTVLLCLQRLMFQVLGQSPGKHAVGPKWRFRPCIAYRVNIDRRRSERHAGIAVVVGWVVVGGSSFATNLAMSWPLLSRLAMSWPKGLEVLVRGDNRKVATVATALMGRSSGPASAV